MAKFLRLIINQYGLSFHFMDQLGLFTNSFFGLFHFNYGDTLKLNPCYCQVNSVIAICLDSIQRNSLHFILLVRLQAKTMVGFKI